jgi:hypothetical protein
MCKAKNNNLKGARMKKRNQRGGEIEFPGEGLAKSVTPEEAAKQRLKRTFTMAGDPRNLTAAHLALSGMRAPASEPAPKEPEPAPFSKEAFGRSP